MLNSDSLLQLCYGMLFMSFRSFSCRSARFQTSCGCCSSTREQVWVWPEAQPRSRPSIWRQRCSKNNHLSRPGPTTPPHLLFFPVTVRAGTVSSLHKHYETASLPACHQDPLGLRHSGVLETHGHYFPGKISSSNNLRPLNKLSRDG